jgi:DNA primase
MPRRTSTPQQPREHEADRERKLATLQARLHDAAQALRTPADWARCLRLAALMPGQDFANILLISSQRPDATLVQDYRRWTAQARQVRRGETGIEIFHVPSRPRRPQDQHEDEQAPTWRDADRITHVWDLSQTTGQSGTVHTGPSRDEMPAKLREALDWLARREGFAIDREHGAPADGTTYWAAHRIRLLPSLSSEQALWALAHQLGHILLHNMPGYPAAATTSGCTGIRKAEADAVALIVCTHYGIAAEHELSRPASWAGSDPRAQPAAAILAAGQRIITASRRIVRHTDRILHGDDPAPVTASAHRPAVPARTGTRTHNATSRRSAGIETKPTQAIRPAGSAGRTRSVLAAAQEFYAQQFAISWAPAYLRARGIGSATSRDWHIGYAPGGWATLTDHLRHLGHSDDGITAAGLAKPSARGTLIDLFRDRVTLPVHDENGTLTGFIGRAHPSAAPSTPKYLNSPETARYKKGELLFGLHEARPTLAQGALPVIVEGPFDAIAVTSADPAQYAGLAPCGTALTCQQAAALSRTADLASTGMLVAFDDDAAGHKAAIRSHSILRPFTWKLHSVLLDIKDPAEILQKQGAAALRTILQERRQPLSAMVIDARIGMWEGRFRDPDGPYLAMLSGASLIAELLPSGSAQQIRAITGNRELQTIDELLRPVHTPELAQIARILPADIAYQIARIADKLGFEYSEVLTEIANATTRQTRRPQGPGPARRHSPDNAQPAGNPTAVQLARTSFPGSPPTAQGPAGYSAQRPVTSINRSHSVRAVRFRA